MMLDAAIKPDARMRPLADLVKMAAFMSPTVSCVPYALDGNTLRPVTGPKNHGDSYGWSPIDLVSAADAPIRGPVPAVLWGPPGPARRSLPLRPAGSWETRAPPGPSAPPGPTCTPGPAPKRNHRARRRAK